MKTPSFMKEYAGYQKLRFRQMPIDKEVLSGAFEAIDKALSLASLGKITIPEAMDIISYPFSYTGNNDAE